MLPTGSTLLQKKYDFLLRFQWDKGVYKAHLYFIGKSPSLSPSLLLFFCPCSFFSLVVLSLSLSLSISLLVSFLLLCISPPCDCSSSRPLSFDLWPTFDQFPFSIHRTTIYDLHVSFLLEKDALRNVIRYNDVSLLLFPFFFLSLFLLVFKTKEEWIYIQYTWIKQKFKLCIFCFVK